MNTFNLPLEQIFSCAAIGFILASIYLGLLWLTIKHLPRVQHKGIYLLLSAATRIFIFLYGVIVFSEKNAGRLIWIVIAFMITRLIIVGIVKQRKTK